VKIALIRHGRTEWNAQGRVQGSTETSLSEAGRAQMAGSLPPAGFENARPFVSPQRRARQTAELLGLENPIVDERLREQNWGTWEGLTRAEMLERDGADAFERAGLGMDFRPPGGESTAELAARVRDFLLDAAKLDTNAVAVAHMGILRSAYALGSGWDMIAPQPVELDLKTALVLAVEDGRISVARLNVPLPPK
jgi:broad specificity phosphatase PhoE